MDTAENVDTSRWVQDRLACVTPPLEWEPNRAAIRFRIETRSSHRTFIRGSRPVLCLAAAAVVCIVAIVTLESRAFGQQLWRWLTLRDVAVVRFDVERILAAVPSMRPVTLQNAGEPRPVRRESDVAAVLGFRPRLPQGVERPARLSVSGPSAVGATVKREDLESALLRANVPDATLPQAWEGAQIAFSMGPTLVAEWSGVNGFSLYQMAPPALAVPEGLDVQRLAVGLLRIGGVSEDQAGKLGHRFATSPFLMLALAYGNGLEVREVALRHGDGILVEARTHDFSRDPKLHEAVLRTFTMLLWTAPDRVYWLVAAGIGPQRTIELANTVE